MRATKRSLNRTRMALWILIFSFLIIITVCFITQLNLNKQFLWGYETKQRSTNSHTNLLVKLNLWLCFVYLDTSTLKKAIFFFLRSIFPLFSNKYQIYQPLTIQLTLDIWISRLFWHWITQSSTRVNESFLYGE